MANWVTLHEPLHGQAVLMNLDTAIYMTKWDDGSTAVIFPEYILKVREPVEAVFDLARGKANA